MAADALPLAEIEDPRIGKAANVIVRLAFIRSLRVVNARNHGRIGEEIHFHIGDVCHGGLKQGIFNIRQEPLLVAEFAIPLCIYETAGDERVKRRGVAMYLSLIP